MNWAGQESGWIGGGRSLESAPVKVMEAVGVVWGGGKEPLVASTRSVVPQFDKQRPILTGPQAGL